VEFRLIYLADHRLKDLELVLAITSHFATRPYTQRGTGPGLAMVYVTVQRHNADIDIDSDSAVDKGTTKPVDHRGARVR